MEQEEVLNRDFKGVWIPKEIYLNKELSWDEKILLIEINSLDKGNGCFASNKYLATFIDVSEGTLANKMTKLRKLGLIVDKGFNGRIRLIGVNAEFINSGTQGSLNNEGSIHGIMNEFVKENAIKRNKKAHKTTKKSVGDIQYRDKEERIPPYKPPQGGAVEIADQTNENFQQEEEVETTNQPLGGGSSLTGVALVEPAVKPETGVADLSTNHQLVKDDDVSKDINKLIDVFYEKNKFVPYNRKCERDAAKDLIKFCGLENAIKVARYALSVSGNEYAPSISTPKQLKEKYSQLESYYIRQKSSNDKNEERKKAMFGSNYDFFKKFLNS